MTPDVSGGAPVASIDASRASSAATVLAHAFMEDPLMVYAWPDARKRDRALRSAFPVLARYALGAGAVLATQPAIEAAGIWIAPGGFPAPDSKLARHGMLAWPFTMGLRGMRRMYSVMGAADKAHEELLHGPHWYLWALGVEPGHQGKGLGSAILREGLGRCDAQGLPCWLETTQPRNVPLYERHGFEVVRVLDAPGAPRTWGMLRPAKRA